MTGSKTRIVAAIVGVILPALAGAQTRTVRVVSSDGQPVAYANVVIDGGETKITDENGEVSLGAQKRQAFTASVTRIGFAPWFGKVDFADGVPIFAITLQSLAQGLAPVTVRERSTFGFFMRDLEQRSRYGFGRIVDSSAIRKVPVVYEALNMAGVRTTANGAYWRIPGCCNVWLDGMKANFRELNELPTDDIGVMEVYKSWAGVPTQYAPMGDCGTLLVWRKAFINGR